MTQGTANFVFEYNVDKVNFVCVFISADISTLHIQAAASFRVTFQIIKFHSSDLSSQSTFIWNYFDVWATFKFSSEGCLEYSPESIDYSLSHMKYWHSWEEKTTFRIGQSDIQLGLGRIQLLGENLKLDKNHFFPTFRRQITWITGCHAIWHSSEQSWISSVLCRCVACDLNLNDDNAELREARLCMVVRCSTACFDANWSFFQIKK